MGVRIRLRDVRLPEVKKSVSIEIVTRGEIAKVSKTIHQYKLRLWQVNCNLYTCICGGLRGRRNNLQDKMICFFVVVFFFINRVRFTRY